MNINYLLLFVAVLIVSLDLVGLAVGAGSAFLLGCSIIVATILATMSIANIKENDNA